MVTAQPAEDSQAMVFLPNMTPLRLDVKQVALTGQSADILTKLTSEIRNAALISLKIQPESFDLTQFCVVDTNM